MFVSISQYHLGLHKKRTVQKQIKCTFVIISNTKYCFRCVIFYKVNGVTKKKQDIVCSRLTLSKQLGRYYKMNVHCMFQDVEVTTKMIHIVRQETKIKLEEYFSQHSKLMSRFVVLVKNQKISITSTREINFMSVDVKKVISAVRIYKYLRPC